MESPRASIEAVQSADVGATERAATRLGQIIAGRRLPGLDGLRAVAVTVVMAYHFGFPAPAGIGVTGFFVLSGFLITWLLRKEQRATGRISIRRFYVRRVLRIFPAYYGYVIVSLILLRYRGVDEAPGLVRSAIFYVMNYYNAAHGHPPGAFSHLWSLAVEEQFYLVWPLVVFLFVGRKPRALGAFVTYVILLVLAWRSIVFLTTDNVAYVYNAFDTRFDSIAIGCLLALAVEWHWFLKLATALARGAWAPLVTLLLLIVSQNASARFHYSVGFTVDSLLLAVLIIQILILHDRALWSWLQHPVIRYVGVISYPMYLYHQWGVDVAYRATMLPGIGQFGITVLVTIAAASASYFLIERPFLALKSRWESRPVALVPPNEEILVGEVPPARGPNVASIDVAVREPGPIHIHSHRHQRR